MKRVWAAALLLGLGACSPIVRHHGYVPAESQLALLQLGVDTRESVVAAVGPPTAGGVVDGAGLYYVQSRFATLGALAPRETSREVLALSFAADGTLGAIERFGLEEGRVVPLSRRVTPGLFAEPGLIARLFGNVGRIDPGTFLGEE